jgi:hypothetical protein
MTHYTRVCSKTPYVVTTTRYIKHPVYSFWVYGFVTSRPSLLEATCSLCLVETESTLFFHVLMNHIDSGAWWHNCCDFIPVIEDICAGIVPETIPYVALWRSRCTLRVSDAAGKSFLCLIAKIAFAHEYYLSTSCLYDPPTAVAYVITDGLSSLSTAFCRHFFHFLQILLHI